MIIMQDDFKFRFMFSKGNYIQERNFKTISLPWTKTTSVDYIVPRFFLGWLHCCLSFGSLFAEGELTRKNKLGSFCTKFPGDLKSESLFLIYAVVLPLFACLCVNDVMPTPREFLKRKQHSRHAS